MGKASVDWVRMAAIRAEAVAKTFMIEFIHNLRERSVVVFAAIGRLLMYQDLSSFTNL